MFDGFFECSLDVPEHEILQLFLFLKDLFEAFKVTFNGAIYHSTSLCHEMHKSGLIIFLHRFDLTH